MNTDIPIVDVGPLIHDSENFEKVTHAVHESCTKFGFFYIVGHDIELELQSRLEHLSSIFFNQPTEEKMEIRMEKGGKAWRGYFPLEGEMTSGKPDLKEGLYFGAELGSDHPKVKAGIPLHGLNLFPQNIPQFKEVVLTYMHEMTRLGHLLMRVISLSLGLDAAYFNDRYTDDPLCLFRIFHYPPSATTQNKNQWGVGEHTDYGVLTILKQDHIGGLQIKVGNEWKEAPVIPNSFICNIGDMLDKMTGGYYKSTPHRVINKTNNGRYSFPFFYDPNFDALIQPVPLQQIHNLRNESINRWDGENVHDFQGTYGEYILKKIGKVFPGLKKEVGS